MAYAVSGHVVEGHAFIDDLVFVIHEGIGMDVPTQLLVVLPDNLGCGGKPVIVQKAFARTEESTVMVFPEDAEQFGPRQVAPKPRRRVRAVIVSLVCVVFDEIPGDVVYVSNE